MVSLEQLFERRCAALETSLWIFPLEKKSHQKSEPVPQTLVAKHWQKRGRPQMAFSPQAMQGNVPPRSTCFMCNVPPEGLFSSPPDIRTLLLGFPGVDMMFFRETFFPELFWTDEGEYSREHSGIFIKDLLELAAWIASPRLVYRLDYETLALLSVTRTPRVMPEFPAPLPTCAIHCPELAKLEVFDNCPALLHVQTSPLLQTLSAPQKEAFLRLRKGELNLVAGHTLHGTLSGLLTDAYVVSPATKSLMHELKKKRDWPQIQSKLRRIYEDRSRVEMLNRSYLPRFDGSASIGCPSCHCRVCAPGEKNLGWFGHSHLSVILPFLLATSASVEQPHPESDLSWLYGGRLIQAKHPFHLLPKEREVLASCSTSFARLCEKYQPGEFRLIPQGRREPQGPIWYWSRPVLKT